jgi:glycine cleavage system aminomethyltransferase T
MLSGYMGLEKVEVAAQRSRNLEREAGIRTLLQMGPIVRHTVGLIVVEENILQVKEKVQLGVDIDLVVVEVSLPALMMLKDSLFPYRPLEKFRKK